MEMVGLFAGVGGLERGLMLAGHHVKAVAEIDPYACAVLKGRFPEAKNLGNVGALGQLPACDIVTAGFPCQDLSQAGGTAGIHGEKSRLVRHALDLIAGAKKRPAWLLLENVPFMLTLHKGAGMAWLVRQLERLGYRWAYRVIDTRAFGLPHRRRRLFILASCVARPEPVLLAQPGAPRQPDVRVDTPHGFYWTEGNRGVGWAVDAIPPLKCSSGLGIISPPAVWIPDRRSIVTPTIEDAEALQGFHRGWTQPASVLSAGNRARWRLVGNAVSVPVAQWIGTRLARKAGNEDIHSVKLPSQHFWPAAGYGGDGARYQVSISEWPGRKSHRSIMEFLSPEAPPLSVRASSGFLGRLLKSNLRVPEQFIEDLSYSVSSASHHADHRSRNEHANVAHARAGQFA
jgi:DNA (cytosine-5)-methyltransferase 1